MKVAYQKGTTRVGGLVLAAGLLLSLAPRADAARVGGAGLTLAVQNAVTFSMLGAGSVGNKVDIPEKAVCRSPFKPPTWVPGTPPSWAPGQAKKAQVEPAGTPPSWVPGQDKKLQAEAPWKKWIQTKRSVKK